MIQQPHSWVYIHRKLIQKDTGTTMLIEVLFMMAKTLCIHTYTMECYSNKNLPHVS